MTFRLERHPPKVQTPIAKPAYDRWPGPDGEDALLFFRFADGYLLRFPQRADFRIAIDTGEIACVPAPEASNEIVTAAYLNQVIPLLLNHRGTLVIHAAAVNLGGHAVAFAGQSGRGKSTFASGFAAAGYPFLTDDALSLEFESADVIAHPSHPSVRLWGDSEAAVLGRDHADKDATEKSRLVSDAQLLHQSSPLPLRAIYFLGEGGVDRPVIAPVPPHLALTSLIQHAFVLDVEDRPRMRAHFDRLADLAERVPVFSFDYPRRFDELPSAIHAIIHHMTPDPAP